MIAVVSQVEGNHVFYTQALDIPKQVLLADHACVYASTGFFFEIKVSNNIRETPRGCNPYTIKGFTDM